MSLQQFATDFPPEKGRLQSRRRKWIAKELRKSSGVPSGWNVLQIYLFLWTHAHSPTKFVYVDSQRPRFTQFDPLALLFFCWLVSPLLPMQCHSSNRAILQLWLFPGRDAFLSFRFNWNSDSFENWLVKLVTFSQFGNNCSTVSRIGALTSIWFTNLWDFFAAIRCRTME